VLFKASSDKNIYHLMQILHNKARFATLLIKIFIIFSVNAS